ncbi:hypothetical protein D3C78_1831550 [compost metagenome]
MLAFMSKRFLNSCQILIRKTVTVILHNDSNLLGLLFKAHRNEAVARLLLQAVLKCVLNNGLHD